MKQPESWEENDLLQLIENKAEESITLEFKEADALQPTDGKKAERSKTEISKEVSAFANSAGGAILYGIKEAPNEPHWAIDLTPIDPKQTSKEWLEQVINSRIQPRILGIVINPVELKTKAPGKFVYVVAVPESSTAHQASDKRYYRRFNFQSVAMEDYEIRQAMNRASRPAYKLQLQPSVVTVQSSQTQFEFRGTLQNESEIVGHDVSVVLFVPRELILQPDDYKIDRGGIEYSRIVGEYIPSSAPPKSAVDSAHPLTPYVIFFRKTILFRTDPIPPEGFTVIATVHDQYGLSLQANFYVRLPTCEIQLDTERHSAKRTPGLFLAGQLQ